MPKTYKDPFDKKYYTTCVDFHQCPICYKCMGPVGKYIKCDHCWINDCRHNEKQREMMIKRENFAITVQPGDPDMDEAFANLKKIADNI